MTKYLDFFILLALTSALFLLPAYVAELGSDHTRMGVLSYFFNNTEQTALHF